MVLHYYCRTTSLGHFWAHPTFPFKFPQHHKLIDAFDKSGDYYVSVCLESPVISISISFIVTASAQRFSYIFAFQLTIAGVFEGIFSITISKRTDLGNVSLKALDGWSPPLRTRSPIRVRLSPGKSITSNWLRHSLVFVHLEKMYYALRIKIQI